MANSGRVVLSRMDEVVYGKPAAESVAELARRYQAERVFLMVSGTLNRETDEIDRLRRALGNHCVGTFDKMPPHTPRAAVIAAAEQAREARADLIVTLGGGSITDGAKAVQLCLANDIHKRRGARPDPHRQGRAAADQPAQGPADLDPDHPVGRRVLGHLGRHRRAGQGEGAVPPSRHHPQGRGARSRGDAPYADVAVPLDRHPRRRSLRRRHLLQRIEPLRRRLGAARPGAAGARPAAGQGRSGRHGGAARLPDRLVAVDGAAGRRRADGRQPRHRLRAGRRLRYPARPHVVHHAALGDALEQIGQRPAPGHGRQLPWAIPARMPATCSTSSSAGSACREAWAR